MAVVTMAELTQRLEQLGGMYVNGDLVSIAIEPGAAALLAQIKRRVYREGKGSEGQSLRNYSKKPIYAPPDVFIKGGFKAQGKNNFAGNTIGDVLVPTIALKRSNLKSEKVKQSRYTLVKPNLKPRKTMYLKEGYKELRDIQGLRTDITNMSYSGSMLTDYVKNREGDSVLLGITTKKSADKYKGLTFGTSKMRGFGMFLQPSAQEIKDFADITQFRILRLTRQILSGGEVSELLSVSVSNVSDVTT